MGSSPRVRGFVSATATRSSGLRFIPACAGFWATKFFGGTGRKVHPRVCGVLDKEASCLVPREGSSPRVRGFVHLRPVLRQVTGFIPACAGFWKPSHLSHASDRVHPRVCGVLRCRSASAWLPRGSSPRVRGFVGGGKLHFFTHGFIPACAGFCILPDRQRRAFEVHPRVCGVLMSASSTDSGSQGSSPRVRGFVRALWW